MHEYVIRNHYLKRLQKEQGNELIKVITGLRRSGKTYVLKMYQDYLKQQGILEAQIVYLNFESFQNEKLKIANNLYDYVMAKNTKETLYLMFDEIQMVKDWQKVINSFRVDLNADIYITGSNASLLSGELATLIAGRYTEIQVFPLSFSEFLQFKSMDKKDERVVRKGYKEYFEYGGMPTLARLRDGEAKYDYLSATYDSILLKDVSSREYGAKNVDTLQRIALFLMDSIGSEVSISKLEHRLRSNKIGVGRNTLNTYLRLMEDAYAFYHVPKFDIKGAKQLSTNGKYYICDIGLWNAQIQQVNSDLGHKLENLVFLELLRRKYSIQVGAYDSKEVDFLVMRNGKKEYYQVAYNMPKKSTREIENLLNIPDNYRKVVITNEMPEDREYKGIVFINIVDWLLEE
ncbi:MAG: ATP-binding protein [Lachnospiraceae bacterium]|nr:ATP-binding protein [Lachnospiraceae bacterium]